MSAPSSNRETGRKLIAQNRKARHDYAILDTYEAGVVLTGTEVKSLRLGRASLVDGFATIDDGELFLRNVHIPEYLQGSWTNHDRRTRKLLMHRAEILRLIGKTKESGLTLVPLSIYLKAGKVKVELALARGKHNYDKRQDRRPESALGECQADRSFAIVGHDTHEISAGRGRGFGLQCDNVLRRRGSRSPTGRRGAKVASLPPHWFSTT